MTRAKIRKLIIQSKTAIKWQTRKNKIGNKLLHKMRNEVV